MERRLIEFVRQHRCLYDRADVDYKNGPFKESKWQEFARINNDSVINVKRRWKTLRDRYFRLIKQEENGNPPCKTYKYFHMLNFLSNSKSRRKYFDNYDDSVTLRDSFKIEDVMLEDTNTEGDYLEETDCIDYLTRSVPKEEVEEHIENTVPNEQQHSTTTTPTPFSLFMQSLAMQIADAGLNTTAVLQLEMKILKLVTDAIIMNGSQWK